MMPPQSGSRNAAMIVALCVCVASLCAQTPLRQRDVEVPGFGVRLSAGWRMLLRDGCRLAVPASWDVSSATGEVFGSDGSMVWVSAVHPSSWSRFKIERKAALSSAIVRDDSEHRLWLEVPNGSRLVHFVDIDAGALVCSCVLDMRPPAAAGQDIAAKIIESVGAAPATWPTELK